MNPINWGEVPSEEVIRELKNTAVSFELTNEKKQVDDLLFGQIPVLRDRNLKLLIRLYPFLNSKKYFTKKILRKKIPVYYSLKEVNDLLLLHIISFYRDKPYYYRVSASKDFIELGIKL